MNDMRKAKDKDAKPKFTSTSKDLIVFSATIVFVFILSYFLDVFEFLQMKRLKYEK